MVEHTSDGKKRSNSRIVDLPPIPTSISESARVGVLNDLGLALQNAGATLNVIDRTAAYSQNDVTGRINDLITAANALGATPAMPTYKSIDYNSFVSVVAGVAAGIATIP